MQSKRLLTTIEHTTNKIDTKTVICTPPQVSRAHKYRLHFYSANTVFLFALSLDQDNWAHEALARWSLVLAACNPVSCTAERICSDFATVRSAP